MRIETEADDADLVKRMLGGDVEAFTLLYRRRQGGVYRYALHMTGRSSMAEEITQEVFLTLITAGRQYDPSRGSFVAFLYGISRHCVLRCLDRERFYAPLTEARRDSSRPGIVPAFMTPTSDPFADLDRRELLERLRRSISILPARYREVVILCELEEMPYADAAHALGCAIGTVRSRLHRARRLLALKLKGTLAVKPDCKLGFA